VSIPSLTLGEAPPPNFFLGARSPPPPTNKKTRAPPPNAFLTQTPNSPSPPYFWGLLAKTKFPPARGHKKDWETVNRPPDWVFVGGPPPFLLGNGGPLGRTGHLWAPAPKWYLTCLPPFYFPTTRGLKKFQTPPVFFFPPQPPPPSPGRGNKFLETIPREV